MNTKVDHFIKDDDKFACDKLETTYPEYQFRLGIGPLAEIGLPNSQAFISLEKLRILHNVIGRVLAEEGPSD